MKRRRKCKKMEIEQRKEQEDKNFLVKRAMVIIFITLKLNS
jgi:hypothetical protein